MFGVKGENSLRLFGDSLDRLEVTAGEIEGIMQAVPGGAASEEALFYLFEGLGHQYFLALAWEQTVALFAFDIAQQIDEVVLCLRQPCPSRQVAIVRRSE